MFEQTFAWTDLLKVIVIGFTELFLVADNIFVIAILVKKLAKTERKRAFAVGVFTAMLLRLLTLGFIRQLYEAYVLQILGALFLLGLVYYHFFHERESSLEKKPHLKNFILIITLIVLADLAFAIDAIYSTLAFISPYSREGLINPKLWVLYFGNVIGLIGIHFSAELFTNLMDRFPWLTHSSHLMISWIGLWLFTDGIAAIFKADIMGLSFYQPVFWVGILFFLSMGFVVHKKMRRP